MDSENLIGKRFGHLVVIEKAKPIVTKTQLYTAWLCRCDCGCDKIVEGCKLKNGRISSCGCKGIYNMEGKRYGKLVVLRNIGKSKNHTVLWECKCDCGNVISVATGYLNAGLVKDCGCVKKEKCRNTIINKVGIEYGTCRSRLRKILDSSLIQSNNKSGVTGVFWNKNANGWQSKIQFRGKQYYLGVHKNLDEAISIRKKAEEKIFGEFLNWYDSIKTK